MSKVICPYMLECNKADECDHSFMHDITENLGCYTDPIGDCTETGLDSKSIRYNKRCVILKTVFKNLKISKKEFNAKLIFNELKK